MVLKSYNWSRAKELAKQEEKERSRKIFKKCKRKGCKKGVHSGTLCYFHQQERKLREEKRRINMMEDYYRQYQNQDDQKNIL
jgi:hypothetical protein